MKKAVSVLVAAAFIAGTAGVMESQALSLGGLVDKVVNHKTEAAGGGLSGSSRAADVSIRGTKMDLSRFKMTSDELFAHPERYILVEESEYNYYTYDKDSLKIIQNDPGYFIFELRTVELSKAGDSEYMYDVTARYLLTDNKSDGNVFQQDILTEEVYENGQPYDQDASIGAKGLLKTGWHEEFAAKIYHDQFGRDWRRRIPRSYY